MSIFLKTSQVGRISAHGPFLKICFQVATLSLELSQAPYLSGYSFFTPSFPWLLKNPRLLNRFQYRYRIGRPLLVPQKYFYQLLALHQLFLKQDKSRRSMMGRRYHDVTTHNRPITFVALVTYDLYQLFFIEAQFDIVIYQNIYRNLYKDI